MFRNADDLVPYKNFNKALKEFFRELPVMLPHCSEAKKPIIYYKMLKTLNKRQPQKRFQQILGPYVPFILNKDDSIFLSPDFHVHGDNGQDMMSIVRTEWKTMTADQRERVWEALHNLVQLSHLCEVHKTQMKKRLF